MKTTRPKALPPHGVETEGFRRLTGDIIAHLLIPADAQRVMPYGQWSSDKKCRAEWVIVLGLYDAHTGEPIFHDDPRLTWRRKKSQWSQVLHHFINVDDPNAPFRNGVSGFDKRTAYREDQIVRPDAYNGSRSQVCAPGIHFFRTFDEAVNYWL